ncbi:hypothetical protein [Nitratifractor salsuginis]|uniref:Lipoprotein n=1 Tax=Nitratifractor salsuginis (strain DSM 16511 / JCM 12458 / E9I37-1) TaxID=749222 RepID=E6X0H5_NITSE|nr:hypothetical protein [Nitratifractor salsuginis]ADV46825.1 hypothetical protein Nitsa_1577 [Nitratifractor salsuginis DSM 16511]
MMKKRILVTVGILFLALGLSGCGGGGGGSASIPYKKAYLQTYDPESDSYVGVEGVAYRCGPDEGVTDADGTFRYVDGDRCTFYDLDDTLSLSDPDLLYLGVSRDGSLGWGNVPYQCISGYEGLTEPTGRFQFDPWWEPSGDRCTFEF